MSEQRPPPSRPPQGPIGWLLSLTGRLIGLVIGALVLRVVLELAGLYFWWPQEGDRHVFQVMKQERVELIIALQSHPIGNEMVRLLENGTTHVIKAVDKLASLLLRAPLNALVYTLVSFMTRLIWLAATFPLLCVCALTGLTEGLVRRDLRRFGSGLESIFIHRYIIKISSSFTTMIWIFYLLHPIYLPAMIVLLPSSLWGGGMVLMMSQSFKRWL